MIKALLDVHTHTIVSGHAYSTLQEMAEAARLKGLHILGMAEHAPSIEGPCSAMPNICNPFKRAASAISCSVL